MEEQIKTRLAELEKSRMALIENLAAHNGAISELKLLLDKLEKPESKT